MQRNSILRPPCSPRSEEEASRQRNRLRIAQNSLLEFNRKLIAEITPTLEHNKDVEAAVSIARLQHSADRLAAISEKLDALACGTRIDGQHDDALGSVEEARRIIALLEIRLREETTTMTSMCVPVVGHRLQENSSTLVSPSQTTPYASMKNSAETALGIRQTVVPPSIGTEDTMILGTPHQQRIETQQEPPQSMSATRPSEENNLDDELDSEGVTAEAPTTEVLEPFSARPYAAMRSRGSGMENELCKRENDELRGNVRKPASDNMKWSLRDKLAVVSESCGSDRSEPDTRKITDSMTTGHLQFGLRDAAKVRTSRSSGRTSDKNAAGSMTTQAAKRFRKSENPRLRATAWVRNAQDTHIQGSLRRKCKSSIKMHLQSVRNLNYTERYDWDSSPDVIITNKHRLKVRRKAKSRRKRRPKIRKKKKLRHRLDKNGHHHRSYKPLWAGKMLELSTTMRTTQAERAADPETKKRKTTRRGDEMAVH